VATAYPPPAAPPISAAVQPVVKNISNTASKPKYLFIAFNASLEILDLMSKLNVYHCNFGIKTGINHESRFQELWIWRSFLYLFTQFPNSIIPQFLNPFYYDIVNFMKKFRRDIPL
jgi:hypothetical protein